MCCDDANHYTPEKDWGQHSGGFVLEDCHSIAVFFPAFVGGLTLGSLSL